MRFEFEVADLSTAWKCVLSLLRGVVDGDRVHYLDQCYRDGFSANRFYSSASGANSGWDVSWQLGKHPSVEGQEFGKDCEDGRGAVFLDYLSYSAYCRG